MSWASLNFLESFKAKRISCGKISGKILAIVSVNSGLSNNSERHGSKSSLFSGENFWKKDLTN